MMARDISLRERIETTLYTAGVHESGAVADAIIECIEQHMVDEPEDLLIKGNILVQGGEVEW